MSKQGLCSLLFVSMLGLSAHASADGTSEWFVGLSTSLGEDTIDNVSHGGTIGTGAIIGNDIDGAIRDEETDDYTAGIGVTLGRRVGNWNLAAEFIWRYRTDWDVEAPTPSIQTITNVFSNVESSTLMFNAARRGVISEHWSWELGAGVGLVHTDIEAEYIEREVPGISPERTFKDNPTDTEFSYNVFAGLVRELGTQWTLNLRLRHIDMGELNAGPFPGRPARIEADHSAQELLVTLERDL